MGCFIALVEDKQGFSHVWEIDRGAAGGRVVPNRHRLSQDGTAASGGDGKMPVRWKIDGGGGRVFCIGGGGVGARYADDEVDLDA